MNKSGFEMIWSTWVIIVLAVVLLAVLLIFFSRSSGSFFDNIKSYFSNSNVDSIVKSCNLMQTGSEYNFCCDKKDVKYFFNGSQEEKYFTCSELANQSFINGKINAYSINCGDVKC